MNLFCQYCQKETAHDYVVKGMRLEYNYPYNHNSDDEEDIYDVKTYCLGEKKSPIIQNHRDTIEIVNVKFYFGALVLIVDV